MAKYEVVTTEKRSYYIEAASSQEAEKKVIDGYNDDSISEDEYTLDVESTEIEEDAEKGKMRVFFRDGSIVAAVDNDDSFAYRHYSKKATDHGFFADASSAASSVVTSDPMNTGMATMSKDTYNEMVAIIDKPKEPEIEDNEPKNGNALAKLIGSLKF